MSTNDFGAMLTHLRGGGKASRRGWNGRDMWIALQVPDQRSKMQQPYIYMSPADGKLVPWLASQADILAEDWLQVHPVPEFLRRERAGNDSGVRCT